MNERSYSWPEGHWDWYRHLAFKHGIRCGRMIFVGGQVDKDASGEPLNVGDLAEQTGVVVAHIARVLEEFGASLADVTRLVAFYATDGDVEEQEFVADVGRHVIAHGGTPDGLGPVIVPTPLPWLALPGMRVEIEAVAMLGAGGERLARQAASPAACRALPAPFQHGVRCGEHVFVGAQSSFPDLGSVLAALDAAERDLVRVGVWHDGTDSTAVTTELESLQSTSVVLPTSRLPAGDSMRFDGWAMSHADGRPLQRTVSTSADDWRWPDRDTQINALACADMVFVSGQLALDAGGGPLHTQDLNTQTKLCMQRTASALRNHGLDLDHMTKQTSYYLGNAEPDDIVTNQRLRSSSYREPAGASTGVPLERFDVQGAMVSVDTIAMS